MLYYQQVSETENPFSPAERKWTAFLYFLNIIVSGVAGAILYFTIVTFHSLYQERAFIVCAILASISPVAYSMYLIRKLCVHRHYSMIMQMQMVSY